jgi:hypothetical protein
LERLETALVTIRETKRACERSDQGWNARRYKSGLVPTTVPKRSRITDADPRLGRLAKHRLDKKP